MKPIDIDFETEDDPDYYRVMQPDEKSWDEEDLEESSKSDEDE